jgi:Xaa-Pro aminopeptidase
MNDEAAEAVRRFVAATTGARTGVAIERESVNAGIAAAVDCPARDITPALDQMRRRKDPDELAALREVIRLTEAGYAAVKRQIAPGMTEHEAYSAMYRAVVEAAGTSVLFRGDFACGTRAINGGGPPTTRKLEAGDLCIFDIFPTWQGYTCDLCRTFSAGPPTELQWSAWERVMAAHKLAGQVIRPGVPCREAYEAVRERLDDSFNHHLGHGVGMDAWEYPWLNAGTDQAFEEGEVVAVEPGLYAEEMRGGIRLEHNYLIGREGIAPLDTFPMELS